MVESFAVNEEVIGSNPICPAVITLFKLDWFIFVFNSPTFKLLYLYCIQLD